MPELNNIWQFQVLFLILARTTSFVAFAPVFSMNGLPGLVRVGIGFFLSVLLYPKFSAAVQLPLTLVEYLIILGKEVLVGITLGFVSSLTFTAVKVAGELVDIQMGFAMASVFDPQNQTKITLVGQFMNILALLLFLTINGHHMLLMAVSHSFDLIPLTGAVFKNSLPTAVITIFIGMISLGFKIAIPFITVLLICDLSLGLLARTVPQLNVFILGFPLKAGLGILTLVLALPILTVLIGNILAQIEKDLIVVMEHLIP